MSQTTKNNFMINRLRSVSRVTFLALMLLSINAFSAEKIACVHLDALGSPIAATDEGGNLLWREEYRPYGDKIQKDPASTINSRAFTGHPHDDTTGLTYAGARHYDPVVGRFMGVDPAPFAQNNIHSFNRYAYGNNNPYRYVDPDGRAAETALDVISLGLSIHEYRQNPSFWNGVGVAVDAIGTVIPFVPAGVGTVRQIGKAGDLAANAARGRASESKVLSDMGLDKNTQRVTTSEGNSIPDALTKNVSVEIKDTKRVCCSEQVRIQTESARAEGRKSVLVTGENTRISGNAEQAFDKVIRRNDLGPR